MHENDLHHYLHQKYKHLMVIRHTIITTSLVCNNRWCQYCHISVMTTESKLHLNTMTSTWYAYIYCC